MSTKLEDQLSRCAPLLERPLDVDAVLRQGLRRRRRRRSMRMAGSAVAVVVTASVLFVGPRPPGSAVVLQQGSTSSQTSSPAHSAPVSEWVDVRAGETLDISLRDWPQFPTAGGNPTIDEEWSSRVRHLVPGNDVNCVAVAPDGAAVFTHERAGGAILVKADGAQHSVATELTNIAATHAPSGHWLLLGQNGNGSRVLQRISADGDVLATELLESYPDRVGQQLQVRGSEVWVVAPWEVGPGEGPREALLATAGGEVLLTDVAWHPSVSTAGAGPRVEPRSPTSFDVALRDGIASLVLNVSGHGDREDAMVTASVRVSNTEAAHTLHVQVVTRPDDLRGGEPVVLGPSAPPDASLLIVHSGETARVTRLTARSQRDTMIADPTGALWFVQTDSDGYRLSRLARLTSSAKSCTPGPPCPGG